ncbi:hypothetical protein [Changpingibacter yushuensis]|uniref:hypothetical protein n=1 Tax=Changpingibacter yushuensis TaxID=2758440 RepID=UPI0015F3EE1D|nr:hypothetical protein [Changpingibacter yushuensis]
MLESARGSIAPSQRWIDLTEDATLAPPLTDALVPTAGDVPASCIDGRPALGAASSPFPHSAGGTLSLWMSGVLTGGLGGPGLLGSLATLCGSFRASGTPISGHVDDSAVQPACGCGAADGMGRILQVFAEQPSGLVHLINRWGFDTSVISHQTRARARALASQVPSGPSLLGTLSEFAQDATPVLTGKHFEVAIVANTRPHTTLDKARFAQVMAKRMANRLAEHKPDTTAAFVPRSAHTDQTKAGINEPVPQAFDIDVWAFESGVEALITEGIVPESRFEETIATLAGLNAAACLVLCAPNMPEIVLS